MWYRSHDHQPHLRHTSALSAATTTALFLAFSLDSHFHLFHSLPPFLGLTVSDPVFSVSLSWDGFCFSPSPSLFTSTARSSIYPRCSHNERSRFGRGGGHAG